MKPEIAIAIAGAKKWAEDHPAGTTRAWLASGRLPWILEATCEMESSGNPNAVGDDGRSVGILQFADHEWVADAITPYFELAGYVNQSPADWRTDPFLSGIGAGVYIDRLCKADDGVPGRAIVTTRWAWRWGVVKTEEHTYPALPHEVPYLQADDEAWMRLQGARVAWGGALGWLYSRTAAVIGAIVGGATAPTKRRWTRA